MRKKMFKRCAAIVMAMLMAFTSSGLATAVDYISGAEVDENTITVTDGMLVAANDKSGEFTSAEKLILQSMCIAGNSFTTTVPAEEDTEDLNKKHLNVCLTYENVISELYELYLKYESLECSTWENIEEILNIFVQKSET